MSKKTHNLVATIGTYKNSEGEEKKRYQRCGSVFTHDDGNISIKLDAMPIGSEFTGWLTAYRDEPEAKPVMSEPVRQMPPKNDDDIPF